MITVMDWCIPANVQCSQDRPQIHCHSDQDKTLTKDEGKTTSESVETQWGDQHSLFTTNGTYF